MFKSLKKLFKKSSISNERGSALAVSLIVVTILTFTITNITSITVNLAGTTRYLSEGIVDDNITKGEINQAIEDFKAYLENEGSYTDYLITGMHNIYGVSVSCGTPVVTTTESGEVDNNDCTFSKEIGDSGVTLSKKVWFSGVGFRIVDPEDPENPDNPYEGTAFDFAIATTGDLIINGGVYEDVNVYGNNIRMADLAFYDDGSNYQLTPENSGSFLPEFGSSLSSIVYNEVFEYHDRFTPNLPYEFNLNSITINEDDFVTVEGDTYESASVSQALVNEFFGTFDFDINVVQQLFNNQILPTYPDAPVQDYISLLNTLSVSEVITQAVNDYSGADAIKAIYVNSETTLTATQIKNIVHCTDCDEVIIVIGDLIIDSTKHNAKFNGNVYCTGNVTLIGDDFTIDGNITSLGYTVFDYDYGKGLHTQGKNTGFSLLSKGSIYLFSQSTSSDTLSSFFFTEASIFIDAVNSKLDFQGALFAQGKYTFDLIDLKDEYDNPIHGIVINSYQNKNNYNNSDYGLRIVPLIHQLDDFEDYNYIPPIEYSVIQTPSGQFYFEVEEFVYQ